MRRAAGTAYKERCMLQRFVSQTVQRPGLGVCLYRVLKTAHFQQLLTPQCKYITKIVKAKCAHEISRKQAQLSACYTHLELCLKRACTRFLM